MNAYVEVNERAKCFGIVAPAIVRVREAQVIQVFAVEAGRLRRRQPLDRHGDADRRLGRDRLIVQRHGEAGGRRRAGREDQGHLARRSAVGDAVRRRNVDGVMDLRRVSLAVPLVLWADR